MLGRLLFNTYLAPLLTPAIFLSSVPQLQMQRDRAPRQDSPDYADYMALQSTLLGYILALMPTFRPRQSSAVLNSMARLDLWNEEVSRAAPGSRGGGQWAVGSRGGGRWAVGSGRGHIVLSVASASALVLVDTCIFNLQLPAVVGCWVM